MKLFLDTSSLIKLYHNEIGTDVLDKLFEENEIDEIFLSDLAKVEFTSAIWKKVRTKELTPDFANEIIDSFCDDYIKYTFISVDSELIEMSRNLVVKYGLKGLRTLDSIQLASIIKIKQLVSSAVSADDLLKSLIVLEGINTSV
jgi:predicted nucleic acid-binding protein